MGEGLPLNESVSTNNAPAAKSVRTNKSSLGYWVGGTGVAIAAGAIFMQSFTARAGQAATETAAKTAAQPEQRTRVVARVNKELVPYDLVADECVTRYGKEVLDDLINRMIIQQACEAAGVSVTEEEVTAEVGRIAKRFNLDPQSWYQMLQTERGLSPKQYRQSVIWPMLALRKLASEKVDISEDEINRAFVRNYGPRVKVRMIMCDNLRRATEVWEQCKGSPDEFESFAQKYSVDPTSRALGGSVPPVPRYSGNDAVEKAAFALKEGEISGIVEAAPTRYVILKCEGRTEPTVNDIAEVRDALYDDLLEQKTQQSVAKVFESVKKNARVDNYLTATVTGPDRAAGPAGAAPGVGPRPAGQTQQVSGQGEPGTGAVRLGTRRTE